MLHRFVTAFCHTGVPHINIGSIAQLYRAFSTGCPKTHLSFDDFANEFITAVHFPVLLSTCMSKLNLMSKQIPNLYISDI